MNKAELIALALQRDMRDLLLACPTERYFVAVDVKWSRPGPTGSALAKLYGRGVLERSSDPSKWGRSRYCFTPIGREVAAALRSLASQETVE